MRRIELPDEFSFSDGKSVRTPRELADLLDAEQGLEGELWRRLERGELERWLRDLGWEELANRVAALRKAKGERRLSDVVSMLRQSQPLAEMRSSKPEKRSVQVTEAQPTVIGPSRTGAAADVVVCKAGSGQYRTIGEAIRSTAPGTRIFVRPGVYAEGLDIDRPLEIIGEGQLEDIIIESSGSGCILMQTNSALLRNLSLRTRAASEEDDYPAADIPQGKLILEDCDIISDTGSCIWIHGPTASPVLRRCKIHNAKDAGIDVFEEGHGAIEDCDIFDNVVSGVRICGGSNPSLAHCAIRDSREGFGVFVYEKGEPRIEYCDIFGNAYGGVEVQDGGNPLVRHCHIHDSSEGYGVHVIGSGRGRIEYCDIYGNTKAGVEISGGGNPTIWRCKIRDGKFFGIVVSDNGRGTVEECNIFRNTTAWGVAIASGANPRISGCKIHGGHSYGVGVTGNGRGTIEDCEVFDNRYVEVAVASKGNPLVRRCTIHHVNGKGVDIDDDGCGTFEDCDIFASEEAAIVIEDSNPIIRRCNVYEPEAYKGPLGARGEGLVEGSGAQVEPEPDVAGRVNTVGIRRHLAGVRDKRTEAAEPGAGRLPPEGEVRQPAMGQGLAESVPATAGERRPPEIEPAPEPALLRRQREAIRSFWQAENALRRVGEEEARRLRAGEDAARRAAESDRAESDERLQEAREIGSRTEELMGRVGLGPSRSAYGKSKGAESQRQPSSRLQSKAKSGLILTVLGVYAILVAFGTAASLVRLHLRPGHSGMVRPEHSAVIRRGKRPPALGTGRSDSSVLSPSVTEPLPADMGLSDVRDFSWFPDKSTLVFSRRVSTTYRIGFGRSTGYRFRLFTADAIGGEVTEFNLRMANRRVADAIGSEDHVAPIVSADGARIAFAVARSDHPTCVYVVSARRSGLRKVSEYHGSVVFGWLDNENLFVWGSPYSRINLSDDSWITYGRTYRVDVVSGAMRLFKGGLPTGMQVKYVHGLAVRSLKVSYAKTGA